jgi:serine phosphatase RsbU (regulator of sigma subunit)/pSer/pThr/pTyr-binding forkhead associated (FHA) protein
MPQLSIVTPDGKATPVNLNGPRMALGRSATNDLSFPEDTGLSRQHLAFEQDGEAWRVVDMGSKNGTVVNGRRIEGPTPLKPGDQILAGHLTVVFDENVTGSRRFERTVVVFDGREEKSRSATYSTDLKHAITSDRPVAANRIDALIRAGQELASHRPLDELFKLILDLAVDSVQAERGVLLTLEGGTLVPKAARGENFRISSGVRDRVLEKKESILVNDVQSNEAFKAMHSLVQQQVRMLMAAPLQTKEDVIGLIYVDSPALIREFSAEDLSLLTVLANVAAIRIEHARLVEVEQAEQLMAKDLQQAAHIQQGLLPSDAPRVTGVDLAGYNVPSRMVGGDYYDFLPYADGRVAIALGDVSGKAMPAALLMTSLHARVRVLAEEPPDNVAEMVTRLNRATAASIPGNRFITFFFSVLDPATGRLVYANAGHNAPLLARVDGTLEKLDQGGVPLGIMKSFPYQAYPVQMHPGDVLLVYSDGATEAQNSCADDFDEERLGQVLLASRGGTASQIVQAVSAAVTEFCAGTPLGDDLTLVVAKL